MRIDRKSDNRHNFEQIYIEFDFTLINVAPEIGPFLVFSLDCSRQTVRTVGLFCPPGLFSSSRVYQIYESLQSNSLKCKQFW